MKKLRKEWLQVLLLAVPFCAAALLWDKLPERMPIHWNSRGHVDGYAGRAFGALFVPCVGVFMALLIAFISKIDPRLRRQEDEIRANSLRILQTVRLGLSGFLAVVSLTILGIGAGLPLNISLILRVGTGLLLLLLGNLLGKVRPNNVLGVRTPWTLKSPEVWRRTHRLAGKIMVGGALVLLLGALVLPARATVLLILPIVLGTALVPGIYSYVVYKKLQPA